ncbi:MAG: hypothetical protein PHX04_03060 [Bacilli bacterium]|nr:hypothetical protein [Bacilli bacterium]
MNKLSNQRIFEVISRDKEFFKYYLKNYFNRLITNNDRLLKIFLEYLNLKETNITNILKLATSINQESEDEVLRDYDLNLVDVPRGANVYQKLASILKIYQTLWKDLPKLEKEALLNIYLTRSQLFKKNNELICFLILISNLIKNYYPPIIIEDKKKYYQIIKLGDALKLAEELANNAENEINIIIKTYKEYYLFPANVSIEEILIQKTIY